MKPTVAGATHAFLEQLLGTWKGKGEIHPNPWGPSGPARGTWTFRFDRARLNLIHDYQEERAEGYRFEGHGVLTVDPDTNDVVRFWFDSYGFPPFAPARGQWSGSKLALEKGTPRGTGRTVFDRSGDGLFYTVEARLKGEPAFLPGATMHFRRQDS